MKYLVLDCEFNQRFYPTYIGKLLDGPIEYALLRLIPDLSNEGLISQIRRHVIGNQNVVFDHDGKRLKIMSTTERNFQVKNIQNNRSVYLDSQLLNKDQLLQIYSQLK